MYYSFSYLNANGLGISIWFVVEAKVGVAIWVFWSLDFLLLRVEVFFLMWFGRGGENKELFVCLVYVFLV